MRTKLFPKFTTSSRLIPEFASCQRLAHSVRRQMKKNVQQAIAVYFDVGGRNREWRRCFCEFPRTSCGFGSGNLRLLFLLCSINIYKDWVKCTFFVSLSDLAVVAALFRLSILNITTSTGAKKLQRNDQCWQAANSGRSLVFSIQGRSNWVPQAPYTHRRVCTEQLWNF